MPEAFLLPALPAGRRPAARDELRAAYLAPLGGPTPDNLRTLDRATWVAPWVRVLSLAEEDDGAEEIDELLRAWLAAPPPPTG